MRRILWGRATSSNVMKVIWTLEELQLPYERIDVGGTFGKTDTTEYRAMNPTGLVPTLQEDDFTLWESNAICRYLCHAHAPHSKLWPQDPRARANVDHWMDAQQTQLNRWITTIFWNLVRLPADQRDAAAVMQAVPEAERVWRMASAELAKHPYLAGDDLTLADVPWGPHLHRWFNMEFDRPEVPHLRAWYERLLVRPAYRQHLAGPVV